MSCGNIPVPRGAGTHGAQGHASRLAFLGTGLMGAPMARRLLDAGFAVAVWNRSREKAEALAGPQCVVHQRAQDACVDADVVFLCLRDSSTVESVLFGAGGVARVLKPGTTIVDFSTIGPEATIDLAGRLPGVNWLDCPVSGGVKGAAAGSLAILAGGQADVLAAVQPYLEVLAANVTLMGEVGAGQAAKLCNQLIVSSTLLAIAEAIRLGESLGVDVTMLPQALRGGFADSLPLQIFGPRMALRDDPGPQVSEVATMFKDVQEIGAAAIRASARLPLFDTVQAAYAGLVAAGLGSADLPILMNLYRSKNTEGN